MWIARVKLANGKKAIRKRRTEEAGEAAIREMMEKHAHELGYHYQLVRTGHPAPFNRSNPSRIVSPKLRWQILERDRHRCRYCGAPAPEVRLFVDHVVPVAQGGTNDPENLVAACLECNNGKGKMGLAGY